LASWENFVTTYVTQWRIAFGNIDEKNRSRILNSHLKGYLLTKPLQVEVLTFQERPKVLFIYTRDKEQKDLEVVVHLNVDSNIVSYLSKLKEKNLSARTFERFEKIVRSFFGPFHVDPSLAFEISDDDVLFGLHSEFSIEEEDPAITARSNVEHIMREVLRETESSAISKNAEEIKAAAEQVSDQNQRNKLLKAAEGIEASLSKLKRLDVHDEKIAAMEGEIRGVRKLIGSSKEYQDWRVLVEDVADFKRTPHVTKELFESEIKRLDQRIDSLKEIKFWSKRTILDVCLAALAASSTIIAGLLAAGIIHL